MKHSIPFLESGDVIEYTTDAKITITAIVDSIKNGYAHLTLISPKIDGYALTTLSLRQLRHHGCKIVNKQPREFKNTPIPMISRLILR